MFSVTDVATLRHLVATLPLILAIHTTVNYYYLPEPELDVYALYWSLGQNNYGSEIMEFSGFSDDESNDDEKGYMPLQANRICAPPIP